MTSPNEAPKFPINEWRRIEMEAVMTKAEGDVLPTASQLIEKHPRLTSEEKTTLLEDIRQMDTLAWHELLRRTVTGKDFKESQDTAARRIVITDIESLFELLIFHAKDERKELLGSVQSEIIKKLQKQLKV